MQSTGIKHTLSRNKAVKKGYLPGIYTEDTPWAYEADIWYQLYFSFCDNNQEDQMDRADMAFEYDMGKRLQMSAEELHQENRQFILDELKRPCWTAETLKAAFADNPVLLELIEECIKAVTL